MGGITYPLYLIHSRAGKAVIDKYEPYVGEKASIVAVLILMLVISFLIHVYFERRMATPLKAFLLKRRFAVGYIEKRIMPALLKK